MAALAPVDRQEDTTHLKPRTLILCFDGTSSEYDGHNTNVVKLLGLLKKDDTNEQLCYYQPGIGTYFNPGVVSPLFEGIAKLLDEAVAWYLDAHVRVDINLLCKIIVLGTKFAYLVGLLPKDNPEQVPFAYKLFTRTDAKGLALAAGFKQTFCRTIEIEFVGVWDTVASVGILASRTLPFTTANKTIKTFRHALSLDERRVKFQPSLYHRPTPAAPTTSKSIFHRIFSSKTSRIEQTAADNAPDLITSDVDDTIISDSMSLTDVLEVWFSGCHSDVGGGIVSNTTKYSLPDITLRWMVREIVRAQCSIAFDEDALKRANIPVAILADVVSPLPTPAIDPSAVNANGGTRPGPSTNGHSNAGDRTSSGTTLSQVEVDAVQPLHDELKLEPVWWLLEIIPLTYTWQDKQGKWHTTWSIHLGRGRCIPDWVKPNFHYSVKDRMADKALSYTPKATWKKGTERYVD